jgi:predicted NAD/FAD-binding protein
VARPGSGVRITFADGSVETVDKVILACHGDQALRLLEDPTDLEHRLLSAFKYQPNTATVHTDPSVMPKTRRCWASWNYRLAAPASGPAQPTIHYWMNRLQGVSNKQDYFVSLNADAEIDQRRILRRIQYEHPLFNNAATAAQKELPALNQLASSQNTFYAGAWFKYGFHEDGFTSALDCARAITGENPWQ